MNEQILLTIARGQWDGEYIAVDVEENIPYHKWWDAGNMWGNRSMQMTWDEVEKLDPVRFRGVNADNWREHKE